MRLNKKTKKLVINIISFLLVLTGVLTFLYLIYYFQTHSSEYLTHEQFYTAMVAVAFGSLTPILGVWINLSNKITDFAKDLGRLEGKLDQFIKSHPPKRRK